MQILVLWDDPDEAELLQLYLDVDDNVVEITSETDRFLKLAASPHDWDVVLLCTDWPDFDAAYQTFQQVSQVIPDCPIVGCCRPDAIYRVAQFLTNGLRSYVIRDDAGDFMFLLHATLDAAVEAVRAERERLVSMKLRQEIEAVRKLQESIIPTNLDSPDGYEVVARYETSQIRVLGGHPVTMAGGDYYDVFRLPDDRMVVVVGDASGHGMRACMSIMTMHTLIRMIRSDEYRDTAHFVTEVNRRLCEQLAVHDDGGFITLLYGVLQPNSHEFEWTSAGHPLPVLQQCSANEITNLGDNSDGGLPLGIDPTATYTARCSQIPPGSRLLLYTDGLAEALGDPDGSHHEFGFDGIQKSLRATVTEPISSALQSLFGNSSAFTRGHGRHDDTSVVLISRT